MSADPTRVAGAKTLAPDEGVRALESLQISGDPEETHCEADRVLCAVLRGAGLGAVADAFEYTCEHVGFWYA